ncbi:unnamed protein product [[Actinomadura] parvosata subsp. kistnae]|uniref:Methyltransferase n=1 Tax=[Actinomadura] parvosata subsp. kistnae TaxID=1909395 RepID=A0A1U9ZWM8_9ACTN|nr:hypothetical protein [Nonomuraea sp. ATCC 55076]AQZ62366.1 hypothetical protein BKM31_13625 [Nonomuraea sp. ATCC 55076]SPL88568.1 unnamed protein product [Actinomadura parvosata subsp. kistnae]
MTTSPKDAYYDLCQRLLGPWRTTELTGAQLCEVGETIYGRAEHFSLYGVAAPAMADAGLRVFGRTAVECCTDLMAVAVAHAVADLHAPPDMAGDSFVAELFCGSGNLGVHLGWTLGRPVYAAELDPLVYQATRHNLGSVGAATRLQQIDYRELLPGLPARGPGDTYIVEPPWGCAISPAGLDLLGTSPPVPEILDDILRARDGRSCLVGIKTIDRILHDSLNVAFADARHLRTITSERPFPDGSRMQFHFYRIGSGT